MEAGAASNHLEDGTGRVRGNPIKALTLRRVDHIHLGALNKRTNKDRNGVDRGVLLGNMPGDDRTRNRLPHCLEHPKRLIIVEVPKVTRHSPLQNSGIGATPGIARSWLNSSNSRSQPSYARCTCGDTVPKSVRTPTRRAACLNTY